MALIMEFTTSNSQAISEQPQKSDQYLLRSELEKM
jgi:hypothetical protein